MYYKDIFNYRCIENNNDTENNVSVKMFKSGGLTDDYEITFSIDTNNQQRYNRLLKLVAKKSGLVIKTNFDTKNQLMSVVVRVLKDGVILKKRSECV